jgi:hypothetical protein
VAGSLFFEDLTPEMYRDLLAVSVVEEIDWALYLCDPSENAADILNAYRQQRVAQKKWFADRIAHLVGQFEPTAATAIFAIRGLMHRVEFGSVPAGASSLIDAAPDLSSIAYEKGRDLSSPTDQVHPQDIGALEDENLIARDFVHAWLNLYLSSEGMDSERANVVARRIVDGRNILSGAEEPGVRAVNSADVDELLRLTRARFPESQPVFARLRKKSVSELSYNDLRFANKSGLARIMKQGILSFLEKHDDLAGVQAKTVLRQPYSLGRFQMPLTRRVEHPLRTALNGLRELGEKVNVAVPSSFDLKAFGEAGQELYYELYSPHDQPDEANFYELLPHIGHAVADAQRRGAREIAMFIENQPLDDMADQLESIGEHGESSPIWKNYAQVLLSEEQQALRDFSHSWYQATQRSVGSMLELLGSEVHSGLAAYWKAHIAYQTKLIQPQANTNSALLAIANSLGARRFLELGNPEVYRLILLRDTLLHARIAAVNLGMRDEALRLQEEIARVDQEWRVRRAVAYWNQIRVERRAQEMILAPKGNFHIYEWHLAPEHLQDIDPDFKLPVPYSVGFGKVAHDVQTPALLRTYLEFPASPERQDHLSATELFQHALAPYFASGFRSLSAEMAFYNRFMDGRSVVDGLPLPGRRSFQMQDAETVLDDIRQLVTDLYPDIRELATPLDLSKAQMDHIRAVLTERRIVPTVLARYFIQTPELTDPVSLAMFLGQETLPRYQISIRTLLRIPESQMKSPEVGSVDGSPSVVLALMVVPTDLGNGLMLIAAGAIVLWTMRAWLRSQLTYATQSFWRLQPVATAERPLSKNIDTEFGRKLVQNRDILQAQRKPGEDLATLLPKLAPLKLNGLRGRDALLAAIQNDQMTAAVVDAVAPASSAFNLADAFTFLRHHLLAQPGDVVADIVGPAVLPVFGINEQDRRAAVAEAISNLERLKSDASLYLICQRDQQQDFEDLLTLLNLPRSVRKRLVLVAANEALVIDRQLIWSGLESGLAAVKTLLRRPSLSGVTVLLSPGLTFSPDKHRLGLLSEVHYALLLSNLQYLPLGRMELENLALIAQAIASNA